MTPTTLRAINVQAFWTSRSNYVLNWFSGNRSRVRFIASAASAPTINAVSLAQTADNVPPLTRLGTRPSNPVGSIGISPSKNLRSERFEHALELISTYTCLDQTGSQKPFPQVRSSAWLYLFNLATCPEQLERASSKFLQFVENGRKWRHEHVNAFVRRCIELRSPELALTVFSNRSAYRMDLTLPAARQLLYALRERRHLTSVAMLAALFPRHNLPALSSDPISCALLVSACLREANASGSESAWIVAATFLSPLKQLLSQAPPMPVSAKCNRFAESYWMKDAMLSILESLLVRGQETGWVRDWCHQSGYNL